jgi:hypothetical protein
MSDMKHDAIVSQGIPIHERIEIPADLLPADSMVEIQAKIAAGYYTGGEKVTGEQLETIYGRGWTADEDPDKKITLPWDDVNVSYWLDDARSATKIDTDGVYSIKQMWLDWIWNFAWSRASAAECYWK